MRTFIVTILTTNQKGDISHIEIINMETDEKDTSYDIARGIIQEIRRKYTKAELKGLWEITA